MIYSKEDVLGGQLFYCRDSIYGVAQVVGVQKNKVVFLDLGKKFHWLCSLFNGYQIGYMFNIHSEETL